MSGCARTEGYYKIDVKEKAVYNHGAMSSLDNDGELPVSSCLHFKRLMKIII